MAVTTEVKDYQNLIGGCLQPHASDEFLDSIDPSTGLVWARVPKSTEEDANKAVDAAKRAFAGWKTALPAERAARLRQAASIISANGAELAALETKGNGWVIRETTYGIIPVLVKLWEDAASEATVGGRGQTVPTGPSSFSYTLREPYGVIAGIAPWNAPLFTFSIKAAYALAAGNTVIIKPSEMAAASSLRLAELLADAFPPGVLNVICGTGPDIGTALVSHPDVAKVSLTGSGGTASAIAQATAGKPKPLILELGGKSANIVFEDADLDRATESMATASIFTGNAGQICVGGSRILVQRKVFDDVADRLRKRMQDPALHRLGHTLAPRTTMGPIATKAQFDKVRSYIDLAPTEGATLLFGGRSGAELFPGSPDLSGGYWVEPTLFAADSNRLRVCQEEIFGPVAVMIPFDTEEEAVRLANDTEFGLAAGVWTSCLSRAHRMTALLEAGNVWVNTYARVGSDLPFGGVKNSGFGTDSIGEYSREKSCVIEL